MSGPSTRRAAHILCYGLLAIILLYTLEQRVRRTYIVGEFFRVDTADVRFTGYRLDPNVAHWSDLACLPGIGPTLAKRIVEFRDQRRASAGDMAATTYYIPEDLLAVPRIGPKTLARIRPYLQFP
ncbi:MAG: helix-hairpin-helix domain-containing protein [Phycisphaerales bacterium]|nr:helix-hairpin-helix domain-containing protein [Phycisphaerales bacterium]